MQKNFPNHQFLKRNFHESSSSEYVESKSIGGQTLISFFSPSLTSREVGLPFKKMLLPFLLLMFQFVTVKHVPFYRQPYLYLWSIELYWGKRISSSTFILYHYSNYPVGRIQSWIYWAKTWRFLWRSEHSGTAHSHLRHLLPCRSARKPRHMHRHTP